MECMLEWVGRCSPYSKMPLRIPQHRLERVATVTSAVCQ